MQYPGDNYRLPDRVDQRCQHQSSGKQLSGRYAPAPHSLPDSTGHEYVQQCPAVKLIERKKIIYSCGKFKRSGLSAVIGEDKTHTHNKVRSRT